MIYPHQDHLGSPVAATNWAGTLQWREDYTPPLPGPSSPVCQSPGLNTLPTADRLRSGEKRQNPVGNQDSTGYTGHVQDDTTGLTYMQARYYDPVIGRFLSNDPVGFAPDRPFGVPMGPHPHLSVPSLFNRYAYVANDPVNLTDPTGQCPWCIAAIAGAVVGAAIEAGTQIVRDGGITDGGAIGRSALVGAASGALGSAGGAAIRGAVIGRGADPGTGALEGVGAAGAAAGVDAATVGSETSGARATGRRGAIVAGAKIVTKQTIKAVTASGASEAVGPTEPPRVEEERID